MNQAPSDRNLTVQALYEPEFTSWFAGIMMLVLPTVAILTHLHDPWMPLWSVPAVAFFFTWFYQLTRNALCTVKFDDEGMSSSLWGRQVKIRWDDIAAATVYVPKENKGSKIFLTFKDGKLAKFWDMAGPVARLLEAQVKQRHSALLSYVQE